MMFSGTVSKKCRYALRAIFELAWRGSNDPVKIQEIALAQAIPPRFLEVILAELKHGGFVRSIRGSKGGYVLARPAHRLTVGEVIAFFGGEQPQTSTDSFRVSGLTGDYAFSKMWQQATAAVSDVYDQTTFADLIQDEMLKRKNYVPDYAI